MIIRQSNFSVPDVIMMFIVFVECVVITWGLSGTSEYTSIAMALPAGALYVLSSFFRRPSNTYLARLMPWLLLLLLEKVQENEKISVSYWILLALSVTAACLCSTLGALLVAMLMGITAVCGAVCYRKWKLLAPTAFCCAPCVAFAVLYLML